MMIQEWIKTEVPDLELLPCCHTTRWETFEKILDQKVLSKNFSRFPDPGIDGIDDKSIIYLFYGLPFYIYETGNEGNVNIEATDDFPIGLIFKPEMVQQFEDCYPFDTGALFNGRYKDLFSCDFSELEAYYRLPVDNGEKLIKMTKRYYKNNESYCYGDVGMSIKETKHTKEENLLRLLNNSANTELDLRVRGFEVHVSKDLSLQDSLLAVVLPKRRSTKYESFLERVKTDLPKVRIIKYRDFQRGNQETFRTLIMDTVMDYYEKEYPGFLENK
jgi:hypothetical protein